jgi:hypothetical protein
MAGNKVVARYLDGTVLKGTTQDFSPGRAVFHLATEQGPPAKVPLTQLKAIFFVRDLNGDPQRKDVKGFIASAAETAHGRKIAVRFLDGEVLCGHSLSYSPHRDGFFLFPSDSSSNNLRVFVVAANAIEIREGAEAEGLAKTSQRSRAA